MCKYNNIDCCTRLFRRKDNLKKVIILVFLIIMVGYAVWQAIEAKGTKIGIEIGNEAPDFQMQTLDGATVTLSSLEGKKVLVNFWASWCGPCLDEMPEIEEIHNEFGNDVEVLAVNMTVTGKNIEAVENFVQEHGLTFPILLDESNKTNSTYEVLSLPTSYFIDTEGVIKHKYIGAMTKEYMIEQLNKLK